MRRVLLVLCAGLIALAACAGGAGPVPAPAGATEPATSAEQAATATEPARAGTGALAAAEGTVDPELNRRFRSADLDVGRWTRVFEGESREIAARRDDIVAALDLRPGERIADVGAGTGLFLGPLSRAVGAEGKVFAVDISPRFLEHMRGRAKRERLDNVTVVEGTDRSIELDPGSVDVVFVCDTYHHFEKPTDMLRSMREALRPGGRLVVIDFHRIPGKSADWILEHVRADQETFRAEIEDAGFRFEREIEVEGVRENYVLLFRRRAE
jgi:SAM-dependent methyltransferase